MTTITFFIGWVCQAVRRVGVGKHLVLADMRPDNANAAAKVLSDAGYEVSVATVEVELHGAGIGSDSVSVVP